MNSTQSQATSTPKPTLHGVKIKQRKVSWDDRRHDNDDPLLEHLVNLLYDGFIDYRAFRKRKPNTNLKVSTSSWGGQMTVGQGWDHDLWSTERCLLCVVFRDNLLTQLAVAKPGDLEDISSILDKTGNTLEYRKYGESLFEILITGGILRKSSRALIGWERVT
jgi:hypothetical protein